MGAVAAIGVATGALPRFASAGAPAPFSHGVASGDPAADGVVLWTRIDATGETAVTWEIARDPDFRSVVGGGATTTDGSRDHTVVVDATGLTPETTYWYRFRSLGAVSPVGRTRTAPAAGTDLASLRLGVVSCSNWTGGFFSPYRFLVERNDLDAIVHLGDYLYEYGNGPDVYGGGSSFGRVHEPATEMLTLDDYRRRHAQYKTDPDLQALHARYPIIMLWDDHEVTDNAWSDGAVNHEPAGDPDWSGPSEGDYAGRQAAAYQAFFEWLPVRRPDVVADPTRIYRRLSFGGLADLHVLDLRRYRSEQVAGAVSLAGADLFAVSGDVADPARSITGDQQMAWLKDGLATPAARWRLVGTSVVFAPLVLPPLPGAAGAGLNPLVRPVGIPGVAPNGAAVNPDAWDGYDADQQELVEFVGTNEIPGVVFLAGDMHISLANDVPRDPGTYNPIDRDGSSVAVEFAVPAISADSIRDALAGAGDPNPREHAIVLEQGMMTTNRHIRQAEVRSQGYGVLDLTKERARMDWFHISDRTTATPTQVRAFAWEVQAGHTSLVAATGDLPVRPTGTAVTTTTTIGGTTTTPRDSELPATGPADRWAAITAAVGTLAALAAGALHRTASQPDGDGVGEA